LISWQSEARGDAYEGCGGRGDRAASVARARGLRGYP